MSTKNKILHLIYAVVAVILRTAVVLLSIGLKNEKTAREDLENKLKLLKTLQPIAKESARRLNLKTLTYLIIK